MTLEQTPPTARSDVRPAPAPTSSAATRPFFAHGTLLTVGALSWAASMAVIGAATTPETATESVIFGVGSGLFQLGLLALLRVLYRTEALGTGRLARLVLRLEAVLVTLAIGSTLADATQVSDLGQPGWAVLDAFWPFSMLGMFLIGIRIALAGRWRGASRFWPMVAESWAVVTIPAMGIFGATVGGVVAIVHLVVGYAVLGQLVARKSR